MPSHIKVCSQNSSPSLSHNTLKYDQHIYTQGYTHVYYITQLQSGRGMCLHVCVCMCVLWRSCCLNLKLGKLVHGALYICKCTNVQIVWVCCIHLSQLQTLRVIDFMLSGLSLLCCSPSDRLVAVRIEGIKGEVTVMSKAACFLLSQLKTSTSTGQV